MNEITPYEQLIAAKLDQVAVPDMADSIWSSIEMQLDVPGDGAGAPDGQGAPGRPVVPGRPVARGVRGMGWYSLALIVAVVSLLWWYFGHKGAKDRVPPKAVPERHAPVRGERVEPGGPVGPGERIEPGGQRDRGRLVEPVEPVGPGEPGEQRDRSGPTPLIGDSHTLDKPVKKGNIPMPAVAPKDSIVHVDIVHVDSAAKPNLPLKVDSSSLQRGRPTLPDVDFYGALPTPPPHNKKHKGVKGITDDDYKITAGKDSGRKRN